MKREEIEAQVKEILDNQIDANIISYGNSLNALTDLFIELSNERCKEQRSICAYDFATGEAESIKDWMDNILNAPLPEIK